MNTHSVSLVPVTDYDRNTYGIVAQSHYVYRTTKSSSPTRVVIWDNAKRDQGQGMYLDPHNKLTSARYTILLTTECTAITSNGTNTGTEASGQVWADSIIRDGDLIELNTGTGIDGQFTAVFPRFGNGHGHLEPVK